jgi:uncharacterized protein
MPTSQAKVPTDAAPRYAKQLLSHLGRKRQVEALEGEPDGGRLVFENGTGTVRPAGDHLLLVAEAADEESLRHVEDVLARHLERFGARRELVVTWSNQR